MKWAILLAMMVLLLGCTSTEQMAEIEVQPTPIVQEVPAPGVKDVEEMIVEPEGEEPVVDETEPAADYVPPTRTITTSERVTALQTKAANMNELQYRFRSSPHLGSMDEFWIKDDMVRRQLQTVNIYNRETFFNNVFMNVADKSSAGHCIEDYTRCQLTFGRVFTTEYDDYYEKTPKDWAVGFSNGEIIGSDQQNGRATMIVEYQVKATTYQVWLDEYYGIALKVVEAVGHPEERTYLFELVSPNVPTAEVTPPTPLEASEE